MTDNSINNDISDDIKVRKKSKYDGRFTTIHGTRVEIGDLLEVHAGEDIFWYGEYNGDSEIASDIIVTYIDKDEEGIYSFQDISYNAPRDSINNIQSIKKGKKNAWKEFGFIYCGRNEILSIEDVDEEEEDEDWDPEHEESSTEMEDTSDDNTESSEVGEEEEGDISDILNSQDEEDEEEEDEEEEDDEESSEEPMSKRHKK